MQNNSKLIHPIKMSVDEDKKELFTTLLQSGIGLESKAGVALGVFLDSLPDFDMDYLSDRVQTIFLDGNALDDLERKFTRSEHVVALSAAMPGLAGAIFRRNSLCAALRTMEEKGHESISGNRSVRVNLKLFNAIALEKGLQLLQHGGIFSGESLKDFFTLRPSLLQYIKEINFNDKDVIVRNFIEVLNSGDEYLLMINSANKDQ